MSKRNREDVIIKFPELVREEKGTQGSHNTRQYAVLISYLGSTFRGLQVQPDTDETVDTAILNGMLTAKIISSIDHKACHYHRSCRTDKGVHALRNVVACRLRSDLVIDSSVIATINAAMPETVRVVGIVLVMDHFRARESCSRRRYHYVLPMYSLDPLADDATEYLHTPEHAAALIAAFNLIASRFVGVQRYHNFVGIGKETPSPASSEAQRKVYSCGIRDTQGVVFHEVQGVHYVTFEIEGQSFLLNMIRKIVGVCLAVCRGARVGLLDAAFDVTKSVDSPMAPGGGLYLHTPSFHSYDHPDEGTKFHNPRTAKFPSLESVWGEEAARSALNIFEESIRKEVGRIETETQSTTKFIRMLRMHNWCVREQQVKKK